MVTVFLHVEMKVREIGEEAVRGVKMAVDCDIEDEHIADCTADNLAGDTEQAEIVVLDHKEVPTG